MTKNEAIVCLSSSYGHDDSICSTFDGKCSAPKWDSLSTAWPLHCHLMANVVHPSEAPDVHDRIYSTPQWGS